MPMLRITVDGTEPRLHGSSVPLAPVLHTALARDSGPVTLMVHGYKYQPGHPVHCPHRSILSRRPEPGQARVVSWPRHLGLRGQRGEGLGLSFGWSARGSIWEAHANATRAGEALARVLAEIQRASPGRAVNLIAHSLGARVLLRGLACAPEGAARTAILLAAAEYVGTARQALSTGAGRTAQVLNVTSRENDLFDFMMEWLVWPAGPARDRMLGHGAPDLPNLVTLQLDDPASLRALRSAGYPIAAPERRICHWSPYLRAGVFPLYRAVFSGALPVARLRALLPDGHAPRWSRLAPGLPRSHSPLLMQQ